MVSLPVPHSECLMLSLMSVAGQWAWTHCHGACKDRAATSSCPLLPQMPTEAFNLPLSSQHRHFSDFKRSWSAQEVQFPAFKVLQKQLSISFWSIQPETCFTEVRKELQTSPQPAMQHCSTPCSLWLLPARATCPAHPHLWHVKHGLETVELNDSNYSMNENNRAFYIALMTNINTTVCFGIFPPRLSWLSAKPLLSHS